LTALAVVIVAHDSAGDLPRTFAALEGQLQPDDEVVVVDSASRDDPASVVPARARLLRCEENVGFAGGAVRGAAATSAPLLLFLNPDAVPAPGCLDALRDAPADWGAWQALVTLPGGRTVNTSGNLVHWLGFGWAGGLGTPVEEVDRRPHEVGFASGAALVVRRADWEAVGGFDAAYFMYGEDLDLSLRLRLAGRGVGVVPAARVEHDYAYAKGDYKWFYLERNRAWTVLAVYPTALLALLAPALVAFEVALLAVAARDGWLGPKLRALAAGVRSLRPALARRRRVQRARAVGAATFAAGLTASLDSPHLTAPHAAQRAQAAYWRLVCAALRARGG
jgi:N-acetylglucosaminyl-diphospho-decaprenol L-rhamnosyltransferase